MSEEEFSLTFLKGITAPILPFPHNFSLAFNAHDVQPFKYSKFSIWPVLASINQLVFLPKKQVLVST